MVDVVTAPQAVTAAVPESLIREVEQFLYDEAETLDQWRLHEWLDLFLPQGHYLVPSTDLPEGDPGRDLFLVQDDRFLLEQRVNSLMKRSAHAEYPHSRTRRIVGNLRVREESDDLRVTANFAVFRVRGGVIDTYVGQYRHVLRRDEDGALRFLERKAILDLFSLRPHGKVSIIL